MKGEIKMSYAERICKAKNHKAAKKAMQAGLAHYGAFLNAMVNATVWDDLPILVAAMQMSAQAMRPAIGETGCEIADRIVEAYTAVAIDIGALRKERGEE